MSLIVRTTPDGWECLAELGLSGPAGLLGGELGGVFGDCVRSTPLRRTARVVLAGGRTVFVKSYAPGAGRIGKIARSRAPAEVEWNAIGSLRDAGMHVPRRLVAIWSGRGDRAPSALLMRGIEIDGRVAAPLDDVLRSAENTELAEAWLRQVLAPWIRRLHDAGFQHRDLYACHVLVEPSFAAEPALIDLARVRRGRMSLRRRVKDLAAMQYSLRGLVREPALRGVLDAYAVGDSAAARSRLTLRVSRKVERIARHRPKYG